MELPRDHDGSTNVITDANQVSVEWLEHGLRSRGALRAGSVSGFRVVEKRIADNSSAVRLRVSYAPASEGALPADLFLKLYQGTAFGRSEMDYYTRDYLRLADPPMPRCHHAAYRPGYYHLLLEDMTASHVASWEEVASILHAKGLAISLASLHANLWGRSSLERAGYRTTTACDIESSIGRAMAGLEPMRSILSGRVDEGDWLQRMEAVLSDFPARYLARLREGSRTTLLHGDTNPGNVLVPRSNGQVLLIDRQPFSWSLQCGLGVGDLAKALVLWRSVEDRRAMEKQVLQTYHQALEARGVTGYGIDQLLEDYRFCLVEALFVALGWCADEADRERMRWLWQLQLDRAVVALQDHDAATIWKT